MTIDHIVSAIRARPIPKRLRVVDLVAHEEIATDVPAASTPLPWVIVDNVIFDYFLSRDSDIILLAGLSGSNLTS